MKGIARLYQFDVDKTLPVVDIGLQGGMFSPLTLARRTPAPWKSRRLAWMLITASFPCIFSAIAKTIRNELAHGWSHCCMLHALASIWKPGHFR